MFEHERQSEPLRPKVSHREQGLWVKEVADLGHYTQLEPPSAVRQEPQQQYDEGMPADTNERDVQADHHSVIKENTSGRVQADGHDCQ